MLLRLATYLLAISVLAACASTGVKVGTDEHLSTSKLPQTAPGSIPAPVANGYSLPPPKAQPRQETYSVVVNNVKVQDLLFALARDAKVNVDIHPGLTGNVTLNALDQTLPQLLNRISKQIDMRFELDGPNLVVMPDLPFLRTYKVDYVNMSREATGSVGVATQIAVAGSSNTSSGGMQSTQGVGSASSDNNSSTRVNTVSKNRFWETLVQNLKDLLRETDKQIPKNTVCDDDNTVGKAGKVAPATTNTVEDKTGNNNTNILLIKQPKECIPIEYIQAASVIANPETGVITVRATSRQQEKVQEFLGQVMSSAKRQVLIEATIAEVTLSQNYQQGINWSKLSGYGFNIFQGAASGIAGFLTPTVPGPPDSFFTLNYNSKGGNFNAAVQLLERFGDVKVLSSPKISVLNNQTAVLKVVDNIVYFTVQSNTNQNQAQTVTSFTTNVYTVPVGLVLNVTPQIDDSDSVLLNLRPSLSRVIGQALDPNPDLKKNSIQNAIPIISSREMESILRIDSGNVAVMGGLMEDKIDNSTDSVPGLARLPFVGGLFQNHNDTKTKTELVIFLRPTVIHDASMDGDYRSLKNLLPDDNFFDKKIAPETIKLLEPD